MNKLNITLPAGAQVSIESDDRELVREVLHSFMPQLVGANGGAPAARLPVQSGASHLANGHNPENGAAHGGLAEATPEPTPAEPAVPPPAAPPASIVTEVSTAQIAPAPAPETAVSNGAAPGPGPLGSTSPDELEFMAFCQRVNPLGDMRKVVVAAEAAHRYLNINSVDPNELERLFNLIGWPIPHSFVQTLRNSARSKFRWLERIPGRPGHYKVTNTGRSIVLGQGDDSSEAG